MCEAARDSDCAVITQVWGLGLAVGRELVWGLRGVLREVERWRTQAEQIPNPRIRHDALVALEHKRPNTDGAALLWTIPTRRSPRLLRLLVAYEIMGDFLDSTVERGIEAGASDGCQLHLALVEAIDLQRPLSDYYNEHPWRDDGGYLDGLVKACRSGCALLPSYMNVRPLLIRAATLAQVQGLNHESDLVLRQLVLEAWASREGNAGSGLGWYETAGAASAWLTVLALMAVAAEPLPAENQAYEVFLAYFPWIALAATLLDSYDDLVDDRRVGAYSYLAAYGSFEFAVSRIDQLVRRATVEARALRHGGERHAVIVASMVALYLSKDSVCGPGIGDSSKMILRSAGPLAVFLGPVLRVWRLMGSMRDT
jgi:tetraprenyl-beta-curcumene synthase